MSVTLPAHTKTPAFDVSTSATVDRLNQGQGNAKDIVEGVKALEKLVTVAGASTSTGTVNDYAIDGLASSPDVGIGMLSWAGASAATFNGFTGGIAGRILLVRNNSSAQTMTLATEAAGSTAANRLTGPAAGLALGPRGAAMLTYDATSSRWQVALMDFGDGDWKMGGAAKKIYLGGSTYLVETGTNVFAIYTNGVLRLNIGSTGGVAIGNTADNGAGTLWLPSGGGLGMTAWPTTAAAANAWVGDNNYLLKSTSSRDFKKNIVPVDPVHAISVITRLEAVHYRGNQPHDNDRPWAGEISEQVELVEPLFCEYHYDAEAGALKSINVNYDREAAYLASAVTFLLAQVQELRAAAKLPPIALKSDAEMDAYVTSARAEIIAAHARHAAKKADVK